MLQHYVGGAEVLIPDSIAARRRTDQKPSKLWAEAGAAKRYKKSRRKQEFMLHNTICKKHFLAGY